eukprot:TRINITY_DN1749_c0_g1_i4.p1 TRINITY_DN1749_c0_g1~~TRINITY_DN1749_c0_g1_i4.p1  ORF type:complete len:441 (+),score=127.25 TRINITY_DN1749_c0_g1_i4:244-1566(+)
MERIHMTAEQSYNEMMRQQKERLARQKQEELAFERQCAQQIEARMEELAQEQNRQTRESVLKLQRYTTKIRSQKDEADRIQKEKQDAEAKKERDRIAAMEEEKRKKEEEQKKKEDLQRLAAQPRDPPPSPVPPPSQPPAHSSASSVSDEISPQASEEMERRRKILDHTRAQSQMITSNAQFESTKKEFYKKIHLPIQQISGTREQIMSRSEALKRAIQEAKNMREDVYMYSLNLAASKFVDQGAMQVSSHKESAFSLAYAIIIIASTFPEFMDILIAQFNAACPFTVPHYISRRRYQSDQEWTAAQGFKANETIDQYENRMMGILRLYAAIIQTKFGNAAIKHPFGIEKGWAWLARILNMKPQKMSASMLYSFLDVAGYRLSQQYGHQFQKLMLFIMEEYFPMLMQADSPKPQTDRVKLFLEKYQQSGAQFQVPKGSDIF